MTRLRIKVTPNSKHNAVLGWRGDELKIAVTAAPEKGKANAAVQKLLVSTLGIAKDSIELVSGQTSARKIIEIKDLSETALNAQLHKLLK